MKMMHLTLGGVLCLIGIVAGKSITASPSDMIAVGGALNITCDSGDTAAPPNLLINGRSTSGNSQVDTVTPPNTPNNLAIFEFSSVALENDGIIFTCTNVEGAGLSITLDVLFMPEISFNNSETLPAVNEGDSATVSFTVDANPAVTANNITVTVGGQSVEFSTSLNGTMVTITLLNLRVSGQYQVEATNIVGTDSVSFQVNVISASSTMVTQSATSVLMSSSSSSSSSSSDSSTMTHMSTSATPGPTEGPSANSATGMQETICFALLLIFFVFMY